jgi:hypothetical protein
MKAVIIKTDRTKEIVEFEPGESYPMLRDAVGGLIECVSLRTRGLDMWVNEEGKFMGFYQNPIANALWEEEYGLTDVMMGDVIITGGADEEGDTIGLNDTELAEIMEYKREIVQLGLPVDGEQ